MKFISSEKSVVKCIVKKWEKKRRWIVKKDQQQCVTAPLPRRPASVLVWKRSKWDDGLFLAHLWPPRVCITPQFWHIINSPTLCIHIPIIRTLIRKNKEKYHLYSIFYTCFNRIYIHTQTMWVLLGGDIAIWGWWLKLQWDGRIINTPS